MNMEWKRKFQAWSQEPKYLLGIVGINLGLTLVLGFFVLSGQQPFAKNLATDELTIVQPAPSVSQPPVTTPTPLPDSQPATDNAQAQTPQVPTESPAPTTDQQAVSDGKININLASLTLLQELPGIGPQKAQAIIDYREQTPFTTIADLQKVSGIGEKTFAKLEQLISVE